MQDATTNPMLDMQLPGWLMTVSAALDAYDDRPFYPLVDPDMPPPGPDVVAHAIELGDESPLFDSKKASARLLKCGPILEQVHRHILYDSNFFLPLAFKGKKVPMPTIPGHLWGESYEVSGPVEADVMMVGKWPGVDEGRKKRNLVGPSGKLLRECLLAAGMPSWEVDGWYVTNLVRHENPDPASKRIPAAWLRDSYVLLEQEIRLVRPKLILCLGSEASAALLKDSPGGISASYGRVMKRKVRISEIGEPEQWHEFGFMTCLHPAAVLHSLDRKPDLVSTIKRFVDVYKGKLPPDGIQKEDLKYEAVWTEGRLEQIVDDIIAEHKTSGLPTQKIAIDLEWHGEYWSSHKRPLKQLDAGRRVDPEKGEMESWARTFQFCHKAGEAYTVVLRHGGRRDPNGNDRVGMPAFVPTISSALKQLKRLLISTPDREVRIIGHYLRSDLPWISTLDQELFEALVNQFEPPEDDPDPDGVNRLFGWQKARDHGGFDTMYAMHSVEETSEQKLEVIGVNICNRPRYDAPLLEDRAKLIKELKVKGKKDLEGYGEIGDVIYPYGCGDADTAFRIEQEMTRPDGLLDKDRFGWPSWIPFWLSQGKMTAELEMEMEGLLINMKRAEALTFTYQQAAQRLLAEIRQKARWPEFNPASHIQVRCLLFGPELAGKLDKQTGQWLDPRPDNARKSVLLNLTPVKTTGKPSMDWLRVLQKKQAHLYGASTDKESLGILLARALEANDETAAYLVGRIRHHRFVNRTLSSVLCPPDAEKGCVYDEDNDMEFDKGILASVEWDGRIRTHFRPVDTGRVGSFKPPVQNLSKRREADYKIILGSDYTHPIRSIIQFQKGYIGVECDISGAELKMMAVQSGSARMVEHCERGDLKDENPLKYDIHSTIAVTAFQLKVTDHIPVDKDKNPNNLTAAQILNLPVGSRLPASKKALWAIGQESIRDVAKTIAFGLAYGRGEAAVVRAVEELGIKISTEDVAKIVDAIFGEYPELRDFFEACHQRVVSPGWLRTCLGRARRFQDPGDDSGLLAEMQRVAGNMPIQGGIADVLTIILRKLRHYPNRDLPDGAKRFYLNCQIHDAVLSAVRIQDVGWYIEEVLPACFRDSVTIWACDLDGKRLPGRPGYHLGYEWGIYEYWGEKLTRSRGLELGVSGKFLPDAKK